MAKHPPPERGGGGGPTRTKPCRYFAQGRCRKGATCHFSHDVIEPYPRREGAAVSPASSMEGGDHGGACNKCAEYEEELTALKRYIKLEKGKAKRNAVENQAKEAPCHKCTAAHAKTDDLRRQVGLAKSHLAEMAKQALLAQRTLDAVEATLAGMEETPAGQDGRETNGGARGAEERPIVANARSGESGAGEASNGADSGAFRDARQSPGGDGSASASVSPFPGSATSDPPAAVPASQTSILPPGPEGQTSRAMSPTAQPPSASPDTSVSLDSVLASCASYLTGSPLQYAAWLREELDIDTPLDLAEAAESCLDDIAEGDGTVGIKPACFYLFEKTVLDAAKGGQGESPAALVHEAPKQSDAKITPGNKSILSTVGTSATPTPAAPNEEHRDGWICSVCTLINPKLYVSCSACGSDSPEVAAERKREEEQRKEQLQAEQETAEKDKKRLKKQRKKEAKLAEQARKEAEERAEVEEDRRLRLKAKQEKKALMDREMQKQHAAQKTQTPVAAKPSAKSQAFALKSTITAAAKPQGDKEAGDSKTPQKAPAPMIIPKSQKATLFNMNRLSSFICSKGANANMRGVHPAFRLLRDESSREDGRKILLLEDSIRRCKGELSDFIKQRDGEKTADELVAEEELKLQQLKEQRAKVAADYKNALNKHNRQEAERKERVRKKQNAIRKAFGDKEARIRKDIKDSQDLIRDAPSRAKNNAKIVQRMEEELEAIGKRVASKQKEINKIRDEVAELEASDPKTRSKLVKLFKGDVGAELDKKNEKVLERSEELREIKKEKRKKENEIVKEKKFPTTWPIETKRAEEQIPRLQKELARIPIDEDKLTSQLAAEDAKATEKFAARRRNIDRTSGMAIDLISERIDEEASRLAEWKRTVLIDSKSIGPLIQRKTKELEKLRLEISDRKKTGEQEDPNFNIDDSRDERGHTLLMMAAQNNDIQSARICLKIGARPTVMNDEGLQAIDYSYRFDFEEVTDLILQSGGSLPKKQVSAFSCLEAMSPMNVETNWDDALIVAQNAALPAESLMESPETCENDPNKRMDVLTDKEQMDFSCFESRLISNEIDSDHVRRVVLLDQAVYNWCLTTQSSDFLSLSNFVQCLEGLKPSSIRQPNVQPTKVQRRAIVGTTTTFEVLGAEFECESSQKVMLFSPFVSGEVEGVSSIGIIVWAVVADNEASLYKTLISNTEFMRAKFELDDRFMAHKDDVLELGRDMHLLDLFSTSIWTTSTMDLRIVDVDQGDLNRILEPGFLAKKRIVYSEELVNRAIFRTSEDEMRESESILNAERADVSSHILGGAGTGKTLLMIRKIVNEDPSKKILVVTRLPRLINVIKTAVEEKRKDGVENLYFSTYDELMQLLSQRVTPDDEVDYKAFVRFDRVRFDCDSDAGVSFSRQFVQVHLNKRERKAMSTAEIEPLTLWYAIITIKSSAKCGETKAPLTCEEYASLPKTFGLKERQRMLCYELFAKYEDWRQSNRLWDEMDRSLYVLAHGPSVLRDRAFVPWTKRVQMGEIDLLDEDGSPLYPFCFDIIAADEAQDFTELDLSLFARMTALRSLFLSADPAQSVELGVKMREMTVNDVMHSLITDKRRVKDILQRIELKTNHRTHQENLELGKSIRRILARSFKVPDARERALIKGKLPQMLRIGNVCDLADQKVFRGGNIVFLAPDERVSDLRTTFREAGITNDVFGVREAKGLEFDACALLGFFGFMEDRGSGEQWQNVLRWLSSETKTTVTSSAEKVGGVTLADCDYTLTHPEVADEAMMLYTALTRARSQLYLVETNAKSARRKGASLADFAFRRFADLKLAKQVHYIDEGHVEMSPAQHKARGVLLVTQALNMSRDQKPLSVVKEKFLEAKNCFCPAKGNDKELFDKCEKHLNAVLGKHRLNRYVKETFSVKGRYSLENRFVEVLQFEQMIGEYFAKYLGDTFLVEEVAEVRTLVEEVFLNTPYETPRTKDICRTVKELTGK